MRPRHLVLGAVLGAVTLLAGCDAGDPTGNRTPSGSRPPNPSPSSTSASAGPRSSATDEEAMTAAAQRQYVRFYTAYVDAGRSKTTTGRPPADLVKMTDAGGPMPDWLRSEWKAAKSAGAQIVAGKVDVTTGPQAAHYRSRQTIKFRACHDSRSIRAENHGKPATRVKWLLLDVEMTAPVNLSAKAYRTPVTWKVYSLHQVSVDEPCTFK